MLALLPAAGNFVGGLEAEVLPSSNKVNWSLHLAAGVVIAVVAVELFPEALAGAPAWLIVLAFAIGGALSLVIKSLVGSWQCRKGAARDAGPGVIFEGRSR